MVSILKRLFFFSIPFFLIALFIIVVDPYNIINISHAFKDDTKKNCLNRSISTSPRANLLWKTFEFKKNPSPDIILGDSRMYHINTSKFNNKFGGNYYNFSIPGANYRTMIDLFWFSAKTINLKNVYWEMSFNQFSAWNDFNIYPPLEKLSKNPIYYFINWDYINDSYAVLKTSLKSPPLKETQSSNARTWEMMRNYSNETFKKYKYSDKLFNELKQISVYCEKNKINLCFVILPDYFEAKDFLRQYNLGEYYARFEKDIKSLGMTIDLNKGIPFSFNKNNYSDYYHIRREISDTIVEMISINKSDSSFRH